MPSSLRTNRLPLVLCLLIGFAPGAMAQELGVFKTISHLGDYFKGEISLQGDPLRADEQCLRLSSDVPVANPDLPWLADAIIAMSPDRTKITITSQNRVNEPAIQLALMVGCGNYMTRHYTVLLSPPDSVEPVNQLAAADMPSPAEVEAKTSMPVADKVIQTKPRYARTFKRQAGESIAGMARRLFPDKPSEQERFLEHMIAFNSEWLSAETLEDLPPQGVVIRYRQSPPKKTLSPTPEPEATAVSATTEPKKTSPDRLVISAPAEETQSRERTMAMLETEISRRLIKVDRDVDDLWRELDNLRAEYKNPPLEIYTQLLELETRQARLDLTVARIKLALQTHQPVQMAAIDAASRPAPEASNVQASLSPNPLMAKPEPALAASLDVAPAKASMQKSPGNGQVWVGLALLLMSGATLGGYLVKKTSWQRTNMQRLAEPKEVNQETMATPFSAISTEASEDTSETATTFLGTDLPQYNYLSPVTEAIQLAEILRLYKRNVGAVDVLKDFIAENPEKALLPSLHLLGMYRDFDNQEAFSQLARYLHTDFNIQEIGWDTPIESVLPALLADTKEALTASQIAQLPHIYDHISAKLGSQECIDYLNNLLHDSRNGMRHGFSVPIAQEILSLVERLEFERKASPAESDRNSA